ncbi:MAG: NADP-dependent phosphogluconate dehydrogenase [Silicimonas sp.]|jgi:6-phosphogluconate dehydrogenase|nr:NADP-dependent phosphogluconate dehydrogenase [Silicimonas sp.]
MADADIGLIGLGTMGAMLALNMAEKGHRVAVYNRTGSVTKDFVGGAGDLASNLIACDTLAELAAAIRTPRAVVLMVPAGNAVDAVSADLAEYLEDGDMIVDAGNANFRDTNRRFEEADRIKVMGIGVSGGAEGARHGPAIMAGGAPEAWERMKPILTAIAAKYDGQPCADYMGPAGAGHFVKAVHNGIEYADMQIIAEAYGLMRDGLGMDAKAIGAVFDKWNQGPLASYLIEISAKVAVADDPETGKAMLDIIADRAGQKGTGRWTVIEAQHLAAPVTVIEAAVAARNTSAQSDLRTTGEAIFGGRAEPLDATLDQIEQALIAGKIICYSQGFEMLRRASAEFDWSLPLPGIAEVWRAGCIIRSEMLNDMSRALGEDSDRLLMHAPFFADILKANTQSLRHVTAHGIAAGHAVPALAAALGYFDAMRKARSTANMIQAQRDFFGEHGFERTDRDGTGFHGPWVPPRPGNS